MPFVSLWENVFKLKQMAKAVKSFSAFYSGWFKSWAIKEA